MVEHIVLFRWKEGASPEAVEKVAEGLKGLRDRVPGIIDLSCGANVCPRAQGYQFGLVVRFPDRAALDAYGPHPAHQDVVENLIRPIAADVLATDYEIA